MKFLACISVALLLSMPSSSEACRVFQRRPVLRVVKFLNPVKLLKAPVKLVKAVGLKGCRACK